MKEREGETLKKNTHQITLERGAIFFGLKVKCFALEKYLFNK